MPDIDVIIVGYGSAGKRHELAARERHLSVVTVDPDHSRHALMFDYVHAFRAFKPQMVVVATPPDSHLEVIEAALQVTPYVLCEKPLCGHGQLGWAQAIIDEYPHQKVNVAYNYRYHRGLTEFLKGNHEFEQYSLVGIQHRKVKPRWGYLLDHVSHDVDIIRLMAKDNLMVVNSVHTTNSDGEEWNVYGEFGDGHAFYISDQIKNKPTERVAGVVCVGRGETGVFVELDADPMMYEKMWDHFIAASDTDGEVDISMSDALVTQKILEKIYERTYHELDE